MSKDPDKNSPTIPHKNPIPTDLKNFFTPMISLYYLSLNAITTATSIIKNVNATNL